MNKNIKAVGVRDLKANLSAYLRDMKAGMRIVVLDRGVAIGELRQASFEGIPENSNPVLMDWVQRSIVQLPTIRKAKFSKPLINSPSGTARSVIDKDRQEF